MPALAVVVPIYIYPLPSAWEPLIKAARENPHVKFLCIINPNNGPGCDVLPDASYAAVLTEMCCIPNIQTIGYVHCTYAQRDTAHIKDDIDRYAGWERESCRAFRIDGIFIDEAPSQACHREYIALLARHVRKSSPGVIIYNPGVVVSRGYLEDADWVVVFEESHQHWYDNFLRHGVIIPSHLGHKTIAMIHSFGALDKHASENLRRSIARARTRRSATSTSASSTSSPSGDALAATALADQVCQLGLGGIYITEQIGGGYNHWPATWHAVVRSIEATQQAQM